ncbi:hypothetical protein ACFVAF_34640 [Streptomyces sp. NPDC057596]|uniref:hypothetical protein n=1 Tax=unclassified Streptomyces TaxID=2593676 RepID=UPI00341C7CFA
MPVINKPMPQPIRRLPAYLAEELNVAQTRVYERHAELAQAWAQLASAEVGFNEALADLNKVLHSVLALPQGEGESGSLG